MSEAKNSITAPIKEAIEDRLGDPIISAYFLSFILWNWDIIIIATGGGLKVSEKIGAISKILNPFLSAPYIWSYDFFKKPLVYFGPLAVSAFYIYVAPKIFKKIYELIETTKVEKRNYSITARLKELSVQQELERFRNQILNLEEAIVLKDKALTHQETLYTQVENQLRESHQRSLDNENVSAKRIEDQKKDLQVAKDSLAESLVREADLAQSLKNLEIRFNKLNAEYQKSLPKEDAEAFDSIGLPKEFLEPIGNYARNRNVSPADALSSYKVKCTEVFAALKLLRPNSATLGQAAHLFKNFREIRNLEFLDGAIQNLSAFVAEAKLTKDDGLFAKYLLQVLMKIKEFHY